MNNKNGKVVKMKPNTIGRQIKDIEKVIKVLTKKFKKEKNNAKAEEISRKMADVEKQLQALKASQRAKALTSKQAIEKMRKLVGPGSVISLPDGKEGIRPKRIVPVKDKENVFADQDVKQFAPSDKDLSSLFEALEDCVVLVLRSKDATKKAVAIPVLFKDIQKARSQRFKLLEMSQFSPDRVKAIRSSMICTALEMESAVQIIDKDVSKFISDNYGAFMESRNALTICSDLLFLTKVY